MQNYIHGRSTLISLLANGKFMHILNPWNIIIDLEALTLTVKKRNWFLIGFDTETFAFKYVRRIDVDTHLFGADLTVQVYGNKAKVYCINKRIARRIEDILIQYNNQKGKAHIVFH